MSQTHKNWDESMPRRVIKEYLAISENLLSNDKVLSELFYRLCDTTSSKEAEETRQHLDRELPV